MKSKTQSRFIFLTLCFTFLLSACVKPAPDMPTQVVNPSGGELPETAPTTIDFLAPTAEMQQASPESNEDPSNSADDDADNSEDAMTATITPFISVPTEAIVATDTSDIATLPPIPTKTATQEPLPASGFDPHKAYGSPQFDRASFLAEANWATNSGDLPDDSNIQLVLESNGNLRVTGKAALYYTWWFSANYIEDGYVEMEVKTGSTCEDKSGYGLILNGPQKGNTSGAHGYVVMLSCDGNVFMDRLDATRDDDGKPIYASTNLFYWTPSEYIQRGEGKTNTLGVLIDDGTITIYVNGFVFYSVYDDTYSGGRLGVFVYPDETANFSYTVTDLTVWELGE